jgi:hypothetical protein
MSGFVSLGGGGIIGSGANPNFATTLYTGNGSTQSIVTGKNNAAGSLTWIKSRTLVESHSIYNTARGAQLALNSDNANGNIPAASGLTVFNSNGFSIGNNSSVNNNLTNYVAWTFLEAAGFFDVVSYTGTASDPLILSHNLGVEVGCIIVKRTDASGDWRVYHRSLGSADNSLRLNSTSPIDTFSLFFTNPTTTDFGVRGNIPFVGSRPDVNANSGSYIAYLFAHNPNKKIACDSFVTDASNNAIVNCGFRPKWLLTKAKDLTDGWTMLDTTRGWTGSNDKFLQPESSNFEVTGDAGGGTTSNGFDISLGASRTYIYIAIG